MKFKFLRLLSLFVVMFTMFSMSAFASNYYSKATAKAVGAGKVYVSYKNQADLPNYAAESAAESGADKQQNAPTHTYYLYAQADEGNVFAGWYGNEACTGSAVSTEANYTVSITANSTDSENPTTVALYAKFVDENAPILSYTEAHVYANLSSGTYKNTTLTTKNVTEGSVTYESSNENVATVAADGTVTFVENGSCFIKAKAGGSEGAYILTVIDDVAAGVTQIANGDFEDWRGVSDSNHAPDNWNSFETNEGTYGSFARAQQVQMTEDHRPGSNGFYCAEIWSRSVVGVVAQGNLTTGCINAGAMSASDKGNYNYSKTEDPLKSETLSKLPTAIRFWAKFVPAAVNADHPNAHMEVVVHDNFNYITYSDPSFASEEEKSHAIAKARKDFPTTNGEWQEFTVPFERTCNAANGQLYVIVNLATNADPGQGQEGDHLYIDDVELVYETEYSEASIEMTDANYATFCAPFDVNVPFGMKAYTVPAISQGNTLGMTEVSGTIPANTPVILSGEGAKTLTAYGVAISATPESGLLTGVYEDTPAPVGSYVLQNINQVVGMYKVAAGQQPTLKANRAYLTVPGSEVKAFFFNTDDATSINEELRMKNEGSEAPVFNLAGQRLMKAQKGINIVNGKKVLY